MARLLIGTSGYSYPDWVGPVYPPGTRAEEYLELYARKLDFVELNFSFYRQPDAATVRRLCGRVPQGFMFAAKAYRALTHERGGDTAAEAQRFREGVQPMAESGQLAAVLLQFPFSFHYEDEARRHLDRVCRALEGLPLAVEFRNRDWERESVLSELRRRGISLASLDLPPLPELPGSGLRLTSGMAYVRFHGRNSANWWTGDNASRYDYRYGAAELDEWATRMLDTLRTLGMMIVAFNNHFRGQAVDNAIELRDRMAALRAEPAAPGGGRPLGAFDLGGKARVSCPAGDKVGTILELAVEALPADCYVFKHSTRCPTSAAAARAVRAHAFDLPLYWVNVIEQRALSKWVAATYGVQHESPQLLEIRGGAVKRALSHYEIREGAF